jgi:mono/diheme cytochrome c family protein
MNGNLAAGMPPFGPGSENSNPIAKADIWNLIAGVFSLSTPAGAIAQGQETYAADCAACHGDTGKGDGPLAGPETASLDLTELSYWFNRSNEMVFAEIESGRIPEHDYALSEAARWAVVDFARTFSYAYIDSSARLAPIEAATIGGEVRNGSTNAPVSDAPVLLRAFTASFEVTLSMTTTLGTDGRYTFALSGVSPDWVFLTSVSYGGLNFSSSAAQISRTQTEQELPITVYEQTTNRNAVKIDQVHLILDFFQGGVAVSELYVISNREAAVFVGETGRVSDGTVQFTLPENAENISFERTLGSFDSTIPATEIIQVDAGWYDTLPLRPGQGSSNLIVRYDLPYENEATLAHTLAYDAANVTVILPDAGVELEEEGWAFRGAQQMPGGSSFLTYERENVPGGGTIRLSLRGRPQTGSSSGDNALLARNNTAELLIGGGFLLIAVSAVLLVVRSWQSGRRAEEYEDSEASEEIDEELAPDRIRVLLESIADLDDAFEKGEMAEKKYRVQREALKSELMTLWG